MLLPRQPHSELRDLEACINAKLNEVYSCLNKNRKNILIVKTGTIFSSMMIEKLSRYAKKKKIELYAFLIEPTDSDNPQTKMLVNWAIQELRNNRIVYSNFSISQFAEDYPDMPENSITDKVYNSIFEHIASIQEIK